VSSASISRRSALGVAGGLGLLLSGCGSDDTTAPTPNPDQPLIDRVAARTGLALTSARAHGRSDLVALHRRHLALLDAPPLDSFPNGASANLAAVEGRLRAALRSACLSCQDGQLAALFASMVAAIAQAQAADVTAHGAAAGHGPVTPHG
jgi:hypothetical protein